MNREGMWYVGLTSLLVLGLLVVPVSAEEGPVASGLVLTPGMMGQVAGEEDEEMVSDEMDSDGLDADVTGTMPGFLNTLDVGGYVEASYTFNFQHSNEATAGQENPGRVFDTNHNEVMFNNFVMGISRTASNDQVVGFNVTAALGQDASTSAAAGLLGDEIDLWDANISVYVPDDILLLGSTKMYFGKFQTTIGGEVLASPDNPNFSRSFLFGFAIPFTHTGLLLERTLPGDIFVVKLGIVNGWDNVKDNNNALSYLGTLAMEPCDWFSIGLNTAWGPEQDDNTSDYRTLLDLVAELGVPESLEMEYLEGVRLLFNFDWGGEEGVEGVKGPAVPGQGRYGQWYGFAGTIVVPFAVPPLTPENEKRVFFALRGEYFDDQDGARTQTGGNRDRVSVWELTFTLGWRPVDALLLRTELRYDKADESVFDNGNKSHQTTIGVDAVFTF